MFLTGKREKTKHIYKFPYILTNKVSKLSAFLFHIYSISTIPEEFKANQKLFNFEVPGFPFHCSLSYWNKIGGLHELTCLKYQFRVADP